MPRVRCHWVLLAEVEVALAERAPEIAVLVEANRADFYAGGMAPDALRLFAGWDKRRSHFYDDQDVSTWDNVADELAKTYPEVADPTQLDPAGRIWVAGYLTHITSDVAYWRHILAHLPPFPQHADAHLGAWLLAEDRVVREAARTIDVNAVRYESAPSWIERRAVERLMARVTEQLLPADGIMPLEVAYYRGRTAPTDLSDEAILAEHGPEWEAAVAKARALLPPGVWHTFNEVAVTSGVNAVVAYLEPVLREASPKR
jgi:hypothetical protein